jgi:carboxymethylenebutenolidase
MTALQLINNLLLSFLNLNDMRLKCTLLLMFSLGLILKINAQEPVKISDSDLFPAVWGVLETPDLPGPHAGVILLTGSAGWRPIYAQIARAFADSGFVALALDYYGETGADTSHDDLLLKWPEWEAMIHNAVAYLKAYSDVKVSDIGLVGYSRGAFLAVSVAPSIPDVKAVVDFFGGRAAGGKSSGQEVMQFPPLLILHGEADSLVPVSFAYNLHDAVIECGGVVEMHIYPEAGHGFNAPWSPMYSEADALDSWRQTIEFLRRYLKN